MLKARVLQDAATTTHLLGFWFPGEESAALQVALSCLCQPSCAATRIAAVGASLCRCNAKAAHYRDWLPGEMRTARDHHHSRHRTHLMTKLQVQPRIVRLPSRSRWRPSPDDKRTRPSLAIERRQQANCNEVMRLSGPSTRPLSRRSPPATTRAILLLSCTKTLFPATL